MAARVVGHCGYLLLSLLMYPVSKQSVFAHLYGSHFPRILAFHRYAGTAAFVVVTLHALLFYIIWLYDGNLWSNVVASEDLFISPACPHHDQYVTRHTLHVTRHKSHFPGSPSPSCRPFGSSCSSPLSSLLSIAAALACAQRDFMRDVLLVAYDV